MGLGETFAAQSVSFLAPLLATVDTTHAAAVEDLAAAAAAVVLHGFLHGRWRWGEASPRPATASKTKEKKSPFIVGRCKGVRITWSRVVDVGVGVGGRRRDDNVGIDQSFNAVVEAKK